MNLTVLILVACVSLIVGLVYVFHRWRKEKKAAASQVAELTEQADALRTVVAEVEVERQTFLRKERWSRDLLDSAQEMLLAYGVTEDGKPEEFLDVNRAACRVLEYEREELLSMTMLDIETVSEPGAARADANIDRMALSNTQLLGRQSAFALYNIQQQIKRVLRGEIMVYEGSYVSRTGKRIPAEISARRSELDGKPVIICRARDVSGRVSAEATLRESKQRFKDLFASSPIGLATYDGQRNLQRVNLACLRVFGIPDRQEFARFNVFDNDFLPASARDEINRGHTVRCEVVIDFDKALERSLFVSNRHGIGHFDILYSNLGQDHDFNALGFIVQVQDLTKWRETEEALNLRERELRQAQKMEAVGTMTSGIAHDFNNILTPILGYADIGISESEEGGQMHDFMREIRKATMRARELVHQILVFSRQTETADTNIHITPILKEVTKQQSTALPRTISVTQVLRSDEDLCRANPTQIHQVLTNFCTNAAYAMRTNGGELELRLSVFTLGWRHRSEFPSLKRGRYLRVSVKDTGSGIEEEVLEHIFDPFFSTKPRGEGTGMGLAVVREIVRSLGGDVAVESVVKEGTTFHVALPLIEAVHVEEMPVWEAPPSGNETVMVVDDEPDIVRMAARMLSSLGYQPVGLTDSVTALETFERNPAHFDVLVTDIVMPEITGPELAEKARAVRPDLPVVLCSGFSEKFTPERAKAMGIREFLVKPVTRQELGEAIRRALLPELPAAGQESKLPPVDETSPEAPEPILTA